MDDTIKILQERVALLEQLLKESYDHHEYCGWGDRWERSIADGARLPQRIEAALANTPSS